MSRRTEQKAALTAAFMVGLLALVVVRTNGWRLPPGLLSSGRSSSSSLGPEDAIYRMLDAARAGDTKAYLDSFAGAIHDQLVQVEKENSEPKFAAYLKSQNLAFQAVAVSIADRPSDSEAQVRVEYVYQGHNDVQGVYLRKESSAWKIVRVTNAEQVDSPIPFGTAVTD
jgi:hypothetical protein